MPITPTFDIDEARTNLSRLVERAAKGEPFLIAISGKPLVKVVPLDQPVGARVRRIGFMAGQFHVPDDFDRMGRDDVERMFGVAT